MLCWRLLCNSNLRQRRHRDGRFWKIRDSEKSEKGSESFFWPSPFGGSVALSRSRPGLGTGQGAVYVRYANMATWLFYLLGVVGLVPEPDGTSGSGTTPSTSWGVFLGENQGFSQAIVKYVWDSCCKKFTKILQFIYTIVILIW